jgi:hypothetical protein
MAVRSGMSWARWLSGRNLLHTRARTHTYNIHAHTTTPKTPHGSSPPFTIRLLRACNSVDFWPAHTHSVPLACTLVA